MEYSEIFKKWYFWLAVCIYAIVVVADGTETLSRGGVFRSLIIGFVMVTFIVSIIWIILWVISKKREK